MKGCCTQLMLSLTFRIETDFIKVTAAGLLTNIAVYSVVAKLIQAYGICERLTEINK